MHTTAASDTAADLDGHLGNFADYPLLTASQERDAALRMRAAARSCLRLLVSDSRSRALLAAFCEACATEGLQVEQFEHRDSYFQLRRDMGELLPGREREAAMAALQDALAAPISSTDLLFLVERAAWPAGLVIGLATLELRALGVAQRDATADALQQWQPALAERERPPHPLLRDSLRHACRRFLHNRDRLVLHNMRLVFKLAHKHRGRGIPLRDLVQEGSGGLLRAAEKYDYRLGYRFSTYAYNWIGQHLQRACEGNGSLVSYPSHVHQDINRLHRARLQRIEETGREPGVDALSELTGMQPDKVRKLRSLNNLTVGIDQPQSDNAALTWGHSLSAPGKDQPALQADRILLRRLLAGRLDRLGDMEQRVLRGRYGLQGREPLTFRELAAQLDISSEWARQLEKIALAKLRDDSGLFHAYNDLDR